VVSANEVTLGQKLGSWIAVAATDSSRPLSPADRIVIRGLQRCREGKPVSPSPAAEGSLDLASLVVPARAAPATAIDPSAAKPGSDQLPPQPEPAAGPPAAVLPQLPPAAEPLPPPGNHSP